MTPLHKQHGSGHGGDETDHASRGLGSSGIIITGAGVGARPGAGAGSAAARAGARACARARTRTRTRAGARAAGSAAARARAQAVLVGNLDIVDSQGRGCLATLLGDVDLGLRV